MPEDELLLVEGVGEEEVDVARVVGISTAEEVVGTTAGEDVVGATTGVVVVGSAVVSGVEDASVFALLDLGS